MVVANSKMAHGFTGSWEFMTYAAVENSDMMTQPARPGAVSGQQYSVPVSGTTKLSLRCMPGRDPTGRRGLQWESGGGTLGPEGGGVGEWGQLARAGASCMSVCACE